MTDINEIRASGRDLPISTKDSIEICNFIRRRNLQDSKKILGEVIEEKRAIPYRRFNMDKGHRKGKLGPGGYPKKACQNILMVLESAEANAKNLNFDAKNLYIKNIIANKASKVWHSGRQRRTKMKRTHIDVVLAEKKDTGNFVLKLPVQRKRSKGGR